MHHSQLMTCMYKTLRVYLGTIQRSWKKKEKKEKEGQFLVSEAVFFRQLNSKRTSSVMTKGLVVLEKGGL